MKMLRPTLLLAAALLAACASVTNPVTGQRELTVMDEKTEIAEGAKAHQEVLKEYGVLDDPALRDQVVGAAAFLARQGVAQDDIVTVVRFSQIIDNPPSVTDALHGIGGAQN